MALSAAFSIAVISIGVAKTGGSIASLTWLARRAGVTRRVNVPFAPNGIGRIAPSYWFARGGSSGETPAVDRAGFVGRVAPAQGEAGCDHADASSRHSHDPAGRRPLPPHHHRLPEERPCPLRRRHCRRDAEDRGGGG